jgi:adenine-specific DNA-methyltransferase
MGILNSRLFVFIYRLLALESGRVLAQVKPTVLTQLPIRTCDSDNRDDKVLHDQMVRQVDQMLDSQRKLAIANTPQEKNSLERQIEANNKQVDHLVYDLYGLTAEEIRS